MNAIKSSLLLLFLLGLLGNTCQNTAQNPTNCGNGTVDTGEACDAGSQNGALNSPCNADCTAIQTGTLSVQMLPDTALGSSQFNISIVCSDNTSYLFQTTPNGFNQPYTAQHLAGTFCVSKVTQFPSPDSGKTYLSSYLRAYNPALTQTQSTTYLPLAQNAATILNNFTAGIFVSAFQEDNTNLRNFYINAVLIPADTFTPAPTFSYDYSCTHNNVNGAMAGQVNILAGQFSLVSDLKVNSTCQVRQYLPTPPTGYLFSQTIDQRSVDLSGNHTSGKIDLTDPIGTISSKDFSGYFELTSTLLSSSCSIDAQCATNFGCGYSCVSNQCVAQTAPDGTLCAQNKVCLSGGCTSL